MKPEVTYTYNATIIEWHDGDTVRLDVDKGFEDHQHSWFRLYGINCPELSTAAGKVARDYVNAQWPPGTTLVAVSSKAPSVPIGKEKYGRWLADLYPSDQTVSAALLAAGYAVPYFGGKKGTQ